MTIDDPDLKERCQRLADQLVLGLVSDPDPVVELGVDLLIAGHDGPAVVELASFSPGERWVDVENAARAALDELGIRIPAKDAAAWSLARYWATELGKGGQTYRRASVLWGLWWTLGNPPEIADLVSLMDEWETTLPGPAREEVEALISLHSRPIVIAADRAIAGLD